MNSQRFTSRSLHSLVYCSRQKFPNEHLIDEEIGRIIDASVINNGKAEITGLLLVHAGWFVQALEGPADHVMTTYQRILNDKRHSDSQVISSGPIVKRNFGNWNMCARRFNKANDAILDTLSQRDAFDPSKLRGPSALRLLTSVGEIQSRVLRESQAQAV